MTNKLAFGAAPVAIAISVMLVSGCSQAGGAGAGVPASLPRASVRMGTGRIGTGTIMLYVSDPTANLVQVYNAQGSNQQPIATIRQGISGPAGLSVDNEGNLYVSNTLGNTVTEYQPNGTTPVATYSQDLLGPVDAAVDNQGTLYVANFYSYGNSIVEFPRGSTSPSVLIRNPCSCTPTGLTVDAQSNLYVAYFTSYTQTLIYEYAKGSMVAKQLNLNFKLTRWAAAGLALDKAGNLLVADQTLPGIQIFKQTRGGASSVIGRTGSPQFVQFDPSEDAIFVTDTMARNVEEYGYPSGKLSNTISAGLAGAYGIAVSPRAPL